MDDAEGAQSKRLVSLVMSTVGAAAATGPVATQSFVATHLLEERK